MRAPSAMRDLRPCPPCGRQGRPGKGTQAGSILRAAGERPPRARPQRRGSPGPIPNPAVKPAFAESTAAQGCGRAGRRARGGRFSMAPREARRGSPPAGLSAFWGGSGFASGPIGVAAHTAPARHRGASRYRGGIVPCGPLRVSSPRTAQGLCAFAAQAPGIVEGSLPHRPGCRRRASCARGPARRQMAANRGRPRIVPLKARKGCFPRGPLRVPGPSRGFRAACAMSADRGAGGPPGGASLPGRP